MEPQASFVDDFLLGIDQNFKYALILFNLMTLVVVYIHKHRNKHPKKHHVLFVTAHPDDEVMFFRPTISSVAKDYFVHLLCLSGKGTQREEQLKKSADNIGVHKVELCNPQLFKDQIDLEWPEAAIQEVVSNYCHSNMIQAIFTFDDFGVSGHKNHFSISKALRKIEYQKSELKFLNKKKSKMSEDELQRAVKINSGSMKIYHLKSVSLIRKYSGCLQVIIALLKDFTWIDLNVLKAYRSMKVHRSQFCWYRKLWVIFSQYNYINSFEMTRIKIKKFSNQGSENSQSQAKAQVNNQEEEQSSIKEKKE